MAETIYLGRDGRQMGPYAWAQIAAMASAGQVRPGDLAWHDGMPDWQPATAVLSRLGLSLGNAPPPAPRLPHAAAPAGGVLSRLLQGWAPKRS
jgi:hypothetical protein